MSEAHESSPFVQQTDRFRGELERLIERLKEQGEKALDSLGVRPPGTWYPAANVIETPDSVIVTLDLPGVTAEALQVQIAGNMLTVSGCRPSIEPLPGHVVHVEDRPAGEFSRSIPMPAAVEHEDIHADLADGVLTVKLSKSVQSRAHSIPVSVRTASSDDAT